MALDRRRAADWPEEAIARTRFHLYRVLIKQDKDLSKAQSLYAEAKEVLDRLLPHDLPEWLQGEEDEETLFDHLLPVSGARFTGQRLFKRFLEFQDCRLGPWAPVTVSLAT